MSTVGVGGAASCLPLRKSHRARTSTLPPQDNCTHCIKRLFLRHTPVGHCNDKHYRAPQYYISNPGLISGQRGCLANENLGHEGGFSYPEKSLAQLTRMLRLL